MDLDMSALVGPIYGKLSEAALKGRMSTKSFDFAVCLFPDLSQKGPESF